MFGLVLCIQLTISVILVSSKQINYFVSYVNINYISIDFSHWEVFRRTRSSVFFVFFCWNISVSISGEQFQAPIILRESSDNEVPLGSRKVFTCNAIGYPSVNYLWLREWKQLSSNYSSSSYFEIGSAKKEDQGSYRCLAKNSVGVVASKAARLTVWFFDGFQDNLSDKVIEVTQFDGAVFQLGTILSSPEPNVQWFMKSNVLMREQTRIISNEKYFLSSSHKLIVLDADFDDEKIYYAIVENIFVGGTKQSPDFRLEVRRRTTAISFSSKPNFIIKPVDQFATIGDPIKSFECLANTKWWSLFHEISFHNNSKKRNNEFHFQFSTTFRNALDERFGFNRLQQSSISYRSLQSDTRASRNHCWRSRTLFLSRSIKTSRYFDKRNGSFDRSRFAIVEFSPTETRKSQSFRFSCSDDHYKFSARSQRWSSRESDFQLSRNTSFQRRQRYLVQGRCSSNESNKSVRFCLRKIAHTRCFVLRNLEFSWSIMN